MAVERSFLVKLLADPKELFKAFQQIQDKAKDSLGEADKEALKLSASFNKIALASTAAFAGTAALITSATKAAIEDQAEQAKLAKTLSTVAGATKETVAETEKFIAAQMKSTTFTDSEMRPALEQLVRSGLNVADAQRQLQLAMDISTQTGVPLIEVSQALSRANNDNFKSLKALSPALADNIKEGQSLEQIFAELTTTFGGAATAAGSTTAGQMQILQNTINETKEAVGAAFIPALQSALGPLQAFANFAQKNSTLIASIAAAVLTFTGVMIALSAAMKLYAIAQTIATIATQRFGIAMSATGVGAVIIGITALVTLLAGLRMKMSQTADAVDELGQRTSQTAQFFNNFNGVSSVAGQRVIFLTNKTLILNSALSTSGNLLNTQVNRLEGLAKSYGVTTFSVGKFNAENQKTGSGVNPLERLKEAKEKVKQATQALVDIQRSEMLQQEALADAADGLSKANDKVKLAQDKLAQAIRGYGKDSKEGIAAARSLAAAQRDVQRANTAVTDALSRVTEAEKKLADLRALKADPDKVMDAEFGLEKSKLDVEEATLRVQEAEKDLAETLKDPEASPLEKRKAELALVQAKFNLRDSVRDVGESERELIAIRATGATADQLADAERELRDAKSAVQDAIDAQTEAVEKLNQQNEDYRKIVEGIRESDAEYVELSADIVQATDNQTTAAKNLRDAQYDAAKATDAVREAEEQLRLSRKEQRVAASGVPGRAFGGPVAGGRPYMVGERGPELFVPTSSGTIIPNNRVGGGGVVVNVTVNAGMGTSGSQVGQEIVDVLRQYTRVSGPLSQYVTV